MEDILLGIKLFALSWVIVSIADQVLVKWELWPYYANICKKCQVFWFCLIFTWNPFAAAIAAFIYYMSTAKIKTTL